VEMRPEYPAGHYYLGRFYLLKKQKYEEAIEELKLFKYWIKEGISRVEEAKTKEAQHKNFINASRYIAYVYLEVLNKPAHAVRELEGLVHGMPVDDPEVYYDLGAAYLRDKKRISAYQAFQKALSMNPKEELKKKAEEAIEVIRAYPDEGGYTKPRGW
ncbi:MAG: tetratricopeptide repeat protein, partial [Candidatus Omnitrophica bacterium]|nr:tetratricopeptide repeat protein [Candidatus Omnitrophota bacterium]